MPRIAVYAICRDEAVFVERFMNAVSEADCVVIADTGSTDGSKARLRAMGAQVFDISISPWRFDDARNASLSMVPADIDVCLSLDMDEIAAPGWRTSIDAGWKAETTRAHYTFVASHTADGRDGITFMNNRMHARHGYRWRHPCHEGLYPDRIVENYVSLPDVRIDHWPDDSKSRASYLSLLESAVAEEPRDPRMAFYYARELVFHARNQQAFDAFSRYMTLGDPASIVERASALLYMARCLEALDRPHEASRYFRLAAAEAPGMREAWIGVGERAYKDGAWAESFGAARTALTLTEPMPGSMTDPKAWDHTAEDLASIAAWNLGLKAESIAHAERALAITPEDERLRHNVDAVRENVT